MTAKRIFPIVFGFLFLLAQPACGAQVSTESIVDEIALVSVLWIWGG